MSVKTKIKIIIGLLVCSAACLLAGCGIGEQTADSFLTEMNAKDQSVTYYANGGTFTKSSGKTVYDLYNLYFPVDSYILVDFDKSSYISIEKKGYVFDGWYKAELDEDGNPVIEDEATGVVKMTDECLNEGDKISSGTHLYVVAKWSLDYQLNVVLVSDGPVQGSDGNVYNSGSVVTTKIFNSNGSLTLTDDSPWASADHTFLQYYTDEACTVEYNGEVIYKPTEEDAENPSIYAKYIEGVWTLVKTTANVRTMFNGLESGKAFYILEDIDCSSLSLSLNPGNFNIRIQGNGHTLSNLSFKTSEISTTNYSVFGTICAEAEISDLTLSNVQVEMVVKTGWSSLYLFCTDIEEGATLDNLVIDGANMKVSYQTGNDGIGINNIQDVGGVYQSDNWLFGGIKDENDEETDAAFLAAFEGIIVKDACLTVNNVTVVDVTNN